ncbi:MAG: SixA phosphatase family protein, partial [Planctomycetia bacterium]
DRLLTSPLRRAVQTADLLQPLLAGPCDVEPLLAAPPGEALLARLRGEYALPGGRRLLLVGHEPHLSALAAWLVHGEPALGAGLRLRKAGLLLLEGEPRPGGMRLVALLPPGLARRLGRG